MDGKFTLKKAIRHFGTINKHKYEVLKACFMAGLYWRGIVHDLSKYSPIEFIAGVKYYQGGTSSPIDAEKSNLGYSLAWLHHRGRNPHHWEYWIDNLCHGGVPLKIPLKYIPESICDSIGAGKVYLGEKWTCKSTLEFFEKKLHHRKMHEETTALQLAILRDFAERGFVAIRKDNIKRIAEKLAY